MADTKISALPASTTPLAGTEVLPIVQSGATKQVSVANLTTGRALSATELTLTTGNLIVANGQGVDFSATPGTGTSELLNDYEEGTWTPAITSSGVQPTVTYVTQTGFYTKIGRMVFCQIVVNFNVTVPGTGALIVSLPFSHNGDNQTTNFAHQKVGQTTGAETYDNIAPMFAAATAMLFIDASGTASSAIVVGSRSFVAYIMYAAS